MNPIKLSYVITTYNKLPYLKQILQLLFVNIKDDEEIVIADGGSSDGTVDYLDEMYKKGKIDQFISEKDMGEAHGYNKTFLLAKGDLIKVITDDDVFYFPAIFECRKFMENNNSIDVLVGNNGTANYPELKFPFLNPEMRIEFEKYANGINETFYCNGLPLMIRRSSIPLLGLFNPLYLCVDLEFTIRTGLIAKYAFATQYIATRIVNPSSNSFRFSERCTIEQLRLCKIYNYPIPSTWNREKNKRIKPSAREQLSKFIKSKLIQFITIVPTEEVERKAKAINEIIPIKEFYNYHYEALSEINKNIQLEFLTKKDFE